MHLLPRRTLSAAANMAVDQLMLDSFPEQSVARFRSYGWSVPSFTMGRTQDYAQAAERLPIHVSWREAHDHFADRFALIRRPTGGGLVDHRDDWTYALVIPSTNPLARTRAGEVYREVHQILGWAFQRQKVITKLHPCPCADTGTKQPARGQRVAQRCFDRAEPGDIVTGDGQKLAGAAQRRTRQGLLMQGSVARNPIRGINWDQLEQDFALALGEWLGETTKATAFPPWNAGHLAATIAGFESPDWNQRR